MNAMAVQVKICGVKTLDDALDPGGQLPRVVDVLGAPVSEPVPLLDEAPLDLLKASLHEATVEEGVDTALPHQRAAVSREQAVY